MGCGRQRCGEALSSLEPPLTSPAWEGPGARGLADLGRVSRLLHHQLPLRDPEAWAESAAGDSGTCRASPRSVGELLAPPEAPTPLWVPGPGLCDQHQLQPCLLLASQRAQPVGVPPGLEGTLLVPSLPAAALGASPPQRW